jgi:hypothetical protein
MLDVHILHTWTKWKDGKRFTDSKALFRGYQLNSPIYEAQDYIEQYKHCKVCNIRKSRREYL